MNYFYIIWIIKVLFAIIFLVIMYNEKHIITSLDVDTNLELKISSIFRLFQMVSSNHSDLLGAGVKDTVEKGICWVVNKIQVNVSRLPKASEEVIISTHAGPTKLFIFTRYYQIYDLNHNLLVSASSTWVLLDINTRKLITHPPLFEKLIPETSEDDISLPTKFPDVELSKIEDRVVRYNDIDLNGHLNNTKYIDYITDLKDESFYKKHSLKSILVSYDKEIKEKEVVTLYMDDSDSSNLVKGKVNGINCFTAYIEYNKR